jgi:hypothetical protein
MERFRATLGGESGERPTVQLPFDAKERFGKARAPVRGTIDGTPFRTTVAVYGGMHLIGFKRELREQAGVAIGDEVSVEIELDDEPRTVEIPPRLAEAFAAAPDAREAFERLSYTHRREYVEWILEAKRADTTERRLDKTIEALRTPRGAG